ncbi:hypothetical protein GEMRC1_008960 [Eukaryota sp. GEM-RC1]
MLSLVDFFFAVGLESFTDAAEDFGELDFLQSIGLGSVPWHMAFALLAVIVIMAAESCSWFSKWTFFYVILIAICAHKFFAALALGTSITRGGIPFGKHFILVAIFALSTPLGQFIGISFSSFLEARAAEVSSAIFASLATGTFAWVALCEILHPEMEKGSISDKRKKVLFAFLGMLSIIIVTAIMEEHD